MWLSGCPPTNVFQSPNSKHEKVKGLYSGYKFQKVVPLPCETNGASVALKTSLSEFILAAQSDLRSPIHLIVYFEKLVDAHENFMVAYPQTCHKESTYQFLVRSCISTTRNSRFSGDERFFTQVMKSRPTRFRRIFGHQRNYFGILEKCDRLCLGYLQ